MAEKVKIEFGDFQTPDLLAQRVCARLVASGVEPQAILEPTCGVGAFVEASARYFPNAAAIHGSDVNAGYLEAARKRIASVTNPERVVLTQADFFSEDWSPRLAQLEGSLLVVGNFPWVTSATQGVISGTNLPAKSNFQGRSGFDAISGKANFDISEWMLLEVLRWFEARAGWLAMLVKTAVARKVLSQAEQQGSPVADSSIIEIDAKRHFGASVDACLLVMRFDPHGERSYDYNVFSDFEDETGRRIGHRNGLTIADLGKFERFVYLLGSPPEKWRSGVKHDASSVMELREVDGELRTREGELVEIERTYCFPLMKGSDVANARCDTDRVVIVTQRTVGEPTAPIQNLAPKTWAYLQRHAETLDARGSSIYLKNPPFSVFGVGAYAFRPWRIAICGLYKTLRFTLVGPVGEKPVMFDDTVYYLSFDSETEARATLSALESESARGFLSSLIFWDEKRPIKASILNSLDWRPILTGLPTDLNLFERAG